MSGVQHIGSVLHYTCAVINDEHEKVREFSCSKCNCCQDFLLKACEMPNKPLEKSTRTEHAMFLYVYVHSGSLIV